MDFNFLKSKPSYVKELKKLDKEIPDKEMSKRYLILKNDLDLKYGKITEYEHDKKKIELSSGDLSKKEKEKQLLTLEKKYGKIDDIEYEKQLYDIDDKPWAKFHMTYNEDKDPNNMQTELVYNESFIKKLINMGYSGETNDDIVQSWLSQVFAANIEPGDLDYSNQEYVTTKKKDKTFIVG